MSQKRILSGTRKLKGLNMTAYRPAADAFRRRFHFSPHAKAKNRLRDLQDRTRADLNDRELWEKACLTQALVGDQYALPLFLAYQVRHPTDPEAAFAIGRLLYRNGDARFLNHMKIALSLPEYVREICRCASAFLDARGRHEEAARWTAIADARGPKGEAG